MEAVEERWKSSSWAASDRLDTLIKKLCSRPVDAGGKSRHPEELMLAAGHHRGFIAAVPR